MKFRREPTSARAVRLAVTTFVLTVVCSTVVFAQTEKKVATALLVDNTGTLAEVAAPWRDRVDVVTAPVAGATAMLVRPDCYVAWASSASQPDQDSLRAALTEWFG